MIKAFLVVFFSIYMHCEELKLKGEHIDGVGPLRFTIYPAAKISIYCKENNLKDIKFIEMENITIDKSKICHDITHPNDIDEHRKQDAHNLLDKLRGQEQTYSVPKNTEDIKLTNESNNIYTASQEIEVYKKLSDASCIPGDDKNKTCIFMIIADCEKLHDALTIKILTYKIRQFDNNTQKETSTDWYKLMDASYQGTVTDINDSFCPSSQKRVII